VITIRLAFQLFVWCNHASTVRSTIRYDPQAEKLGGTQPIFPCATFKGLYLWFILSDIRRIRSQEMTGILEFITVQRVMPLHKIISALMTLLSKYIGSLKRVLNREKDAIHSRIPRQLSFPAAVNYCGVPGCSTYQQIGLSAEPWPQIFGEHGSKVTGEPWRLQTPRCH